MKKTLLLAIGLLSCAAATAQSKQPGMLDVVTPDATTACQSTFSTGSSATLLKFCVTANGNITQFESPITIEYIAHGGFGEGYGFCDATSGVAYADYGTIDSGNWNAPVRTQPGGPNTLPLKIARTTSDGIWTLTQVFGRNPGERYVKVTMTLKNNSAVSRNAQLIRYADVDAPFGASEFTNRFDYTVSYGLGYVQGHYGLAIQTGTPSAVYNGFAQTSSNGPDPCNPFLDIVAPASSVNGDGSVAMFFFLSVPKTAAKTVAIIYRPF